MLINKSLIYAFIIFSVILLLLDIIWLSIAPKLIYKPNLPGLLLDKPVLWAAMLFYIIYSVGVALIIIRPALINESILQGFWTGLIFGIVAYGTWSLTNMAVLKAWSPLVTFIDMFWGGFLTSVSATLSLYLINKIFNI